MSALYSFMHAVVSKNHKRKTALEDGIRIVISTLQTPVSNLTKSKIRQFLYMTDNRTRGHKLSEFEVQHKNHISPARSIEFPCYYRR